MDDQKYFKTSRKYLELANIYYNEYNNKLSSEEIFENNFKYEISLIAFGLNFSYSMHGFNQHTALFARKIIEDYYLYKLKETTLLTHSNFKIFKIASYKGEVGTQALKEISKEFKLPINAIKHRMFDNDFWLYPYCPKSFEDILNLDYEGKIKDKTDKMLKKLYRSYGIFIHYSNSQDFTINEFKTSLSLINQLVREVIGKDYERVKVATRVDKKEEKYVDKSKKIQEYDSYVDKIKESCSNLGKACEKELRTNAPLNLYFTYNSLIATILSFLESYFDLYNMKARSIGLYLNKVFIEELSYYYALLEMDATYNSDYIFALSNIMINKLSNSYINEKISLEDSILSNKIFNFYYDLLYGNDNKKFDFVDKYKNEPYKLINQKYESINSFVQHFISTFNKKDELKYIHNEASSIGHSYGLIQNHEFNYKKTFLMLLDVIENFLRYYSIIFVSRNFNTIDKKKEKELLNSKVEDINNRFIDLFNYLKEDLK